MTHDNSSLFTFDQHYRRSRVLQKMFSKQTLLQMEILQFQLRMSPSDKCLRLLNPMPCFCIITHHLTGSYQSIYIHLPENCRASPFCGCSYAIHSKQPACLIFAKHSAEILEQRVNRIMRLTPFDIGRRDI